MRDVWLCPGLQGNLWSRGRASSLSVGPGRDRGEEEEEDGTLRNDARLLSGGVLVALGVALALSAAEGGAGGGPEPAAVSPHITDEGQTPGLGAKIALYPVNRAADFLDVISLQFGFGFGLHLNGHATRALQLGGGASAVTRLGIDGRHGGLANEAKSEISVLPFTAEYFKRQNSFGFFPEYRLSRDVPWLYSRYRDYTGLGAEATVAILNLGLEAHPVELVDLVAGLVGVDFRADDYPPRWTGRRRTSAGKDWPQRLRRVVVVPSRVVDERTVRMERSDGMGVYYKRLPLETHLGAFGGWIGSGADARAAEEFNRYLSTQQFSVSRELLESVERVTTVDCKWDTVGVDQALKGFATQAVTKGYKRHRVRRLPDYQELARVHGADAVLDVRVWEWGIWRHPGRATAVMRLDCEFKVIAFPQNELLFSNRFVYSPSFDEKEGLSLTEFARGDGENLVVETKHACDVVTAQFRDVLVERR